MDTYPALQKRDLPAPPHWSKAIGVGVVVMGLAIGTGELILWPHLITKHGLGLLWLALLGIIFQYFINQEVARHEIATGEGFFTTSVEWWRLAIGGILVGFGTRLSKGCTSGHGISGLASLSSTSLVAVITFISVGILTALVVQRLGVLP